MAPGEPCDLAGAQPVQVVAGVPDVGRDPRRAHRRRGGDLVSTAPPVADVFAEARAVADAVLFEGYVLYPYRASARKNRMRWQFGVLVPSSYADLASERSKATAEFLLD